MYKDARIGVVVPAYNEEKLIGWVLETTPDFVDYVVVVDDCSQDRTAEIASAYGQRWGDHLKIIRHEMNRGVGEAIITGYRRALELNLDVIAVMASDAQVDPEDLTRVIEPVIEAWADYTKGNRLFTGEV